MTSHHRYQSSSSYRWRISKSMLFTDPWAKKFIGRSLIFLLSKYRVSAVLKTKVMELTIMTVEATFMRTFFPYWTDKFTAEKETAMKYKFVRCVPLHTPSHLWKWVNNFILYSMQQTNLSVMIRLLFQENFQNNVCPNFLFSGVAFENFWTIFVYCNKKAKVKQLYFLPATSFIRFKILAFRTWTPCKWNGTCPSGQQQSGQISVHLYSALHALTSIPSRCCYR